MSNETEGQRTHVVRSEFADQMPQLPPVCDSIRPENPGFGCEGYAGHEGDHHALNRSVFWAAARATGGDQ